MKMRLKNLTEAHRQAGIGVSVLFSLVGLFALGSCAGDTELVKPGGGTNSDEATLTLQLKAPYFAQPTRSISGASQDVISTLDVLAFRINGDGTNDNDPEYFDYHAPTYMDGAQHKAKVVVKSYPQRFLVIANAREEVKALVDAFRDSGANRETVMQELTVALASGAKWNATSDINYKPLPMYGESVAITVSPTTPSMGTISMVRMHSKIEVTLSDAIFSSNKFQLRSIHVYNTNTSGRVAPIIDATGTYFDRVGNVAVAPSLPASVTANTVPLLYIAAPTEGKAMMGGIFTFEALAATAATSDKQPSIVVGGVFELEKDGSNNEIVTYYRVDFVDGVQKYIPLLRNHTYMVNVKDVSRRGFDTPEEAFDASPINIETAIVAWDNGMWQEVADDGQFKMAISQKVYSYSKEVTNDRLTISTNWTQGLGSVKFSSDPTNANAGGVGWLTQTSLISDGATSGLRTYDLSFEAAQNGGALRIGYIHLLAGRMHMVVRVEQSDIYTKSLLKIFRQTSLGVFNEEVNRMIFYTPDASTIPLAQKYKIKWWSAAGGGAINIKLSSTESPIVWRGSSAPDRTNPIIDPSGEKVITVQPTAFTDYIVGNVFSPRLTFMTLEFQEFMDPDILALLAFEQRVRDLYIRGIENMYIADGSTYKFNVEANTRWKAYFIDNGSGLIESPAVSTTEPFAESADVIIGRVLEFKTKNHTEGGIISGTGKIRIEWFKGTDPNDSTHWQTEIIDLNCTPRLKLGANSYMVKNSSTPVVIPTRQVAIAMGHNDKPTEQVATDGYLGMGWVVDADYAKLKVGVLWTDIPKALGTADAVVKSVTYDGKHVAIGSITVTPGTGVGSAIIMLYVDENGNDKYDTGDIIKWSWHIWSAGGYYPYDATGAPSTIWMDRNMGATTNIRNQVSSLGFYYQWGRKDPFGGSGSITVNNVFTPLYTSAGTPSTLEVWTDDRIPNCTLLLSVNEPTVTNTAWSDHPGYLGKLWNNNGKTVFDPCPEGYRVPIKPGYYDPTTHYWGSSDGPATWSNYGLTWEKKGGWYPAAGMRTGAGIGMKTAGTAGTYFGRYWSASMYQPGDYYMLRFDPSNIVTSYHYAYIGQSIRCVVEN